LDLEDINPVENFSDLTFQTLAERLLRTKTADLVQQAHDLVGMEGKPREAAAMLRQVIAIQPTQPGSGSQRQ
jgi:hypothetical protein